MQKLCPRCKTVLTVKKKNKFKAIFTCRRADCPNFNKDVETKKLVIKA